MVETQKNTKYLMHLKRIISIKQFLKVNDFEEACLMEMNFLQ
jgi:hypothetical protein